MPERVRQKLRVTANQFATLSIGILLVVTAMGKPQVMFGVALTGLLIGFNFLRKENRPSSVLAVTIAFFLVMIIALVMGLKK